MKIEIEREADGRWIADVPELPGVMVYGETRDEAIAIVEALALRIFAERQRRPSLDQVLARDGLPPIPWERVPEGEQTVTSRFADYIEAIRKPAATLRRGKGPVPQPLT